MIPLTSVHTYDDRLKISLKNRTLAKKRKELQRRIAHKAGTQKWYMEALHNECKKEQKLMLTNVNMQRNEKSFLQMFAFLLLGGSLICRCLPILCPCAVPRSHFCPSQTVHSKLIINNLYLQIATSASESKFCVGK